MAYKRKTYDCGVCKDIEYTWNGNYGAKGESRAPRKKPSPEQIEKQNQRNKETRVRRKMLLNFKEGDYWCTLKYKKGYRPSTKQVLKDFKNFRTRLGNRYRSRGQPLKYIYRIEIGKQGGVHIHFLINDIGGTDKLVATEWNKVQQAAGIYFAHAYEDGNDCRYLFPVLRSGRNSSWFCDRSCVQKIPAEKVADISGCSCDHTSIYHNQFLYYGIFIWRNHFFRIHCSCTASGKNTSGNGRKLFCSSVYHRLH